MFNILAYSAEYCMIDCEVLCKGYWKFRDWMKEATIVSPVKAGYPLFTHPPSIMLGISLPSLTENHNIAKIGVKIVTGIRIESRTEKYSSLAEINRKPSKK